METLLVEHRGAWSQFTLNRPETRNALNTALLARLAETLEERAASTTCRAVLICGAGGHFAAGADIGEVEGKGSADGARDPHKDCWARIRNGLGVRRVREPAFSAGCARRVRRGRRGDAAGIEVTAERAAGGVLAALRQAAPRQEPVNTQDDPTTRPRDARSRSSSRRSRWPAAPTSRRCACPRRTATHGACRRPARSSLRCRRGSAG